MMWFALMLVVSPFTLADKFWYSPMNARAVKNISEPLNIRIGLQGEGQAEVIVSGLDLLEGIVNSIDVHWGEKDEDGCSVTKNIAISKIEGGQYIERINRSDLNAGALYTFCCTVTTDDYDSTGQIEFGEHVLSVH